MLIAYVGSFLAGHDSAGLQRVLGNAAALGASGHRVVVAGQGAEVVDDVPFPQVSLVGFGDVSSLSRVKRVLGGHGVQQWLEDLPDIPDVLISYGGTGPFTRVVERWARDRNVPRVIDSVEWYEAAHMPGGVVGPKALDNEYSMRFRYPRYDGAIAISSFLKRHYQSKGTPSVCVPPLLDVLGTATGHKNTNGPVTIVYAGNPGKKDSLGTLVSALERVDPEGRRLRIEVLGVEAAEGRSLPGMPTAPVPGVDFLGRVTRAEALARVSRADYVPIIRPDMRFAHAGFPTKVAEAMASGVAVLGNHTSDLAMHVKDMQTGVVVFDDSLQAVVDGLQQALAGGKAMAAELGVNARIHAEKAFHYQRYSPILGEWMEGLKRG